MVSFLYYLIFFIFLFGFHCHHYGALPPPVFVVVMVLSLLYSIVSVPNLHRLPLMCATCNHTNCHLSLSLSAVGTLEKALECALTYLLFHEREEFVTENVEYYREALGHNGKPREVSDSVAELVLSGHTRVYCKALHIMSASDSLLHHTRHMVRT